MKLLTLTPIHIGNGEVLKPFSYILGKGVIYVLDMDRFFSLLSRRQQEQYLGWIDPILDKLSDLDKKISNAQKDFELRRQLQNQRREFEQQLSISWFISNRIGGKPFDFAQKCSLYSVPFTIAPGRDGVRTHMKDINHRAYIPGTEIKGSFRTSLLYALLQRKENYQILKTALDNFRTTFRSGKSPKEKMRELRKISTEVEGEILRGKKNDAKLDFMKLISVSDTSSIPSGKLCVETTQMVGTTRYTRTCVETIASKIELDFDLSISTEFFLDKLELGKLRDCLSESKLLDVCYHRSKEILEEEERYFSNKPSISTLIAQLKKQNEPFSPLLRLGTGQGFLGTTIALKIRQEDPNLYEEAVREPVSFQRRWRTEKGNFPKTRRVVIDANNNPVSFLGWLKITRA